MAIADYGVLKRQTTNTERWLAFTAMFIFGFITACNLFKAPPILPFLGEDLGISPGMLGMIMTCYSIAAAVFAPIGAFILRALGGKATNVLSCVIMIIGTGICLISSSAGMFLFGRIIEGVAFGMIMVVGPNILPRMFTRKQMGLAVGIWSQWIPCGTIIAFFAAPMIWEATQSWKTIWMVTLILGIIALILMLVFFKMSEKDENTIVGGDATVEAKHGKQFMTSAVVVCAVFLFWAYLYVVNINQLYPTFLMEVKGMSTFSASMLPNWLAIITIPLGIIAGVISDKFAIRKKCIVIFYFVVALIFFFLAFTPGEGTAAPWAFCIIMGICASFIPTYTRGITPVLVTESFKTDMALMVMALVSGLGMCAAVIATQVVAHIGWFANAQFVCAPLAVISAVLVLIFVKDDAKVVKIREQEEAEARAEAGQE